MNPLLRVVVVSLVFVAPGLPNLCGADDPVRLEDLSAEERKQRIRDQLAASRRQHAEGMLRSPGVWQAGAEVAKSEYSSIEWQQAPIGFIAQFYASLTRTEVMVSAQVARLEISVRAHGLSKQTAASTIESALAEAGVEITKIGAETTVLTRREK